MSSPCRRPETRRQAASCPSMRGACIAITRTPPTQPRVQIWRIRRIASQGQQCAAVAISARMAAGAQDWTLGRRHHHQALEARQKRTERDRVTAMRTGTASHRIAPCA